MMEFLSNFWYIWAFVALSVLGVYLYNRYKAKQQMQAQFVVVTSALLGCIMLIFYGVGIISAVLTSVVALKRLFG